MITTLRHELLQKLVELSNLYPEMRWGQLLCFVSSIAGADEPTTPDVVDDAAVLAAAEQHLQSRCQQLGREVDGETSGWPLDRLGLVRELEELSNRHPTLPLGLLVFRLSALARTNIYDAEDSELLTAAQYALVTGEQAFSLGDQLSESN